MNINHQARLEEFSRHNEKVNKNQWKASKRKAFNWMRKI
ncbi:hypothetical protein KP77_20220 [Jeotgalibacillus alimentarius]|uniref:Uncharacterized protein n=1 Tax=Jeotgalibacillus alimentarius TaxID=135826 RepID=A0A0C2VWM7_9BACL|nr:hypothetical protein KP77_20220 [Jeotgalibacillus alimentarius]